MAQRRAPAYVVFDLAVGFTVVAVSLAVWESHPGNRIGPLLFVNSAWFLISPVRYIASPFWISLAWVAQLTSSAVFAHMVLAYPSGRLKGAWTRALSLWSTSSVSPIPPLS